MPSHINAKLDAPLHGPYVLAPPGLSRQLHADTQSSLLTSERTLLVSQKVKSACSMPHGADCTQRISGQSATGLYDVKTFIAHDVGSTGLVISSCASLLNRVAYLAPMKCTLSSSAIVSVGRVALSIVRLCNGTQHGAFTAVKSICE